MDLHLTRRAVLRVLAAAALTSASVARADLFSPGDLAKPHAGLDGLGNCAKCHPGGDQLSAQLCLDCHGELAPRVKAGRGFHGRLPAAQKEACETCHHDHQGRDYDIFGWGKAGEKGFDHKKTGWPLYGKHGPLECKRCHEPRFLREAAVAAHLEKHPGRRTFLGLSRDCSGCHFDEHRGQVSTECSACHDETGWKPAPGFNHDETEYPLTGLHKKVKCEACHPKTPDPQKGVFPAPVSETFLRYAPVEHRQCLDCHKDVHQGRFGPRCQSCHTTASWHAIRDAAAERGFHDKARYKLKGEHLDVQCAACHGPSPGRPARFKNLAFEACTDCHPDAHFGQLTRARGERVAGCEGCHTVEGFEPAKYGPLEHAKASYPLEGAHAAVGCNACHPPAPAVFERPLQALVAQQKKLRREALASPALFELGKKGEKCESCHTDVHARQFKDKACEACHGVESFVKTAFDHQKDSRFRLEGKHAQAKCAACHQPAQKGVVRYKPLPLECLGCHEDVHVGQLAEAPGAPTKCERCHGVEDWKKTAFRHQAPFTAFTLDGQHAKVECRACHVEVDVGRRKKAARYKPLPSTCEGCHADFHRGAFKGFAP